MRGGTRDIAAAVIGANVIPMPVPVTTSAGSNVCQLVVVDTRLVIRRMPTVTRVSPVVRIQRAPMRSESRPEIGATNMSINGIGIIVSPASSGVMPSAPGGRPSWERRFQQAERYGEADDGGDPEVADGEELELDHRIGDTPLPPDEDDENRGAEEQQSKRLRAGPAELGPSIKA